MNKAKLTCLALIGALPAVWATSINLCTDDTCGTCPNGLIITAPTDDRPCLVYLTSDITSGGGYPALSDNGQEVYLNAFPDEGTGISVRSPAVSSVQYCGAAVGFVNSYDTCGPVYLQDTFTLEFCGNNDDCIALGIPGGGYSPERKKRIRGTGNLLRSDDTTSTQHRIVALKRADGSFIKPVSAFLGEQDYMPEFMRLFNATDADFIARPTPTPSVETRATKIADPGFTVTPNAQPTDSSCTAFVPDSEDYYIRPDSVTYTASSLLDGGDEGSTIERSDSVETSWSTTVSGGFNFELFSSSVSFTTEESMTTDITYTISVPADQTGYAGWTPFYKCVTGVATCGSDARPGEACTPYNDNGGNQAGEFTFVAAIT